MTNKNETVATKKCEIVIVIVIVIASDKKKTTKQNLIKKIHSRIFYGISYLIWLRSAVQRSVAQRSPAPPPRDVGFYE